MKEPWKTLIKLQNPFMEWLLKSRLHGFVSRMYMLITFTGRKSGKVYTTPVQYAQRDNMLYVITSAEYIWWRNLRDDATVDVTLRRKTHRGTSRITEEQDQLAAIVQRVYPQFKGEALTNFLPGKIAIIIALSEGE